MFLYLCDPLFLAMIVVYLVNRVLLEPFLRIDFLQFYMNDLICIPILVPPMLFVARRLHLRSHDLPPLMHEIFIPMIIWSILFEILLPQSEFWRRWVSGDPYDVLCYVLGASFASQWWMYYYRQLREISP